MSKLSSISSQNPLVLVGCGKMGGAMLQGWLKAGLSVDAVLIVDPFLEGVRKMLPDIEASCLYEKLSDLPKGITPGFAVLAVKPQMMNEALDGFKTLGHSGTVFLSIAAGKTIGYFEGYLGLDATIVRSMPNTPAAIGKGITVGCPNKNVTEAQKDICHELLSAAGEVEWVSDEKLIDAVTAISGSGPAYVFYLVEALAGAGEQIGLSPELAKKLASHTISGSGALLEQSALDAGQLRVNVTSPKGTTEAALNVLMGERGLGPVILEAVRAAHNRSKELAE